MKKINRILNTLEMMAKAVLKMQRGYDSNKVTLPKKMEEFLPQGYFAPWDYFTTEFYNKFNTLNNVEQRIFIENISKHTTLFACVKAGFQYGAEMIYEDWGNLPILQSDYMTHGFFDEEAYEADLKADQKRFAEFANTNFKKNHRMLGQIIHEGSWTAACPGHRKVLRMKHHPW